MNAYIKSMGLTGVLMETDRWSFKPALVSSITVAAVELICQLPGLASFLLIPLSLLGYGITMLAILAMALYCVIKKRPRRGASVLLVLLLPVLLWRPIEWAADNVHIGLTVGFGAGQLGAPSKSSDGHFVTYDWSVGFAGGPSTVLIYDITDEIAVPMAQQTHPQSSELGIAEECAGRVHHLISHYYVCSF